MILSLSLRRRYCRTVRDAPQQLGQKRASVHTMRHDEALVFFALHPGTGGAAVVVVVAVGGGVCAEGQADARKFH